MSQPAINRKLATRFAILLLILAALIFGYQIFRKYRKDPLATVAYDSAGQILAIEMLDEGSRTVLVQPDGTVLPSPGYVDTALDREAVWKADGSQVFFVSDRERGEPHIFRWSPGANEIEQRSLDSRGKGAMSFSNPGTSDPHTGLMTSGGTVLLYDPTGPSSYQLLPPVGRDVGKTEEGGAGSQFEIVYSKLGGSFKSARFGLNRDYVVAIMKREDSEVLILQDLTKAAAPYAVTAGQRVDFDINPVTGDIVFAAIDFQFSDPEQVPEQFIVNGRQKRPFNHVVGIVNPANPTQGALVVQNTDDKLAFSSPKYSPNGSTLALIIGPYEGSGSIKSEQLALMPAADSGGRSTITLVRGDIREPAWTPDGQSIVYVRNDVPGQRPICMIGTSASEEKRITKIGRFQHPIPSPATR